MAPDYREVGASGGRYGREFILRLMDQNAPVDAAAAGWRSEDCAVRRLGLNTYLFTYTLCRGSGSRDVPRFGNVRLKGGAFSTTRAQLCRLKKTASRKRRDGQRPASRNQRGVEESLAALAEAAAPGRTWYRRSLPRFETYAMVGETSGRLKTLFDEYGEM